MSFTSNVKNEVSKLDLINIEKTAELSAIIRNGIKKESDLKITTENPSVARHIFNLIKDLFNIHPFVSVRRSVNYQKKYQYILIIKDTLVLNEFLNNIPRDYLLDDEDSKRAYLRGLFLMCGSINDPKKSRYHLEFLVDDNEYSLYINDLINSFNLNSKVIKRENKYMIYIKEAEKIGDFLRIIKAYNAVLYYEDIRIYRDHKNMTNRLNNCEQANVERIIDTAFKQVNDIENIINNGAFDLLNEKEQIVANYRLKYKEVSLAELSEIISLETSKNISKSGVYHRFKKITFLADQLRNKM